MSLANLFTTESPPVVVSKLDPLRGFNFSKVFEKMRLSEPEFVMWLQSLGLLPPINPCPSCSGNMKVNVNGVKKLFRCSKRTCNKKFNLSKRTFFEGCKISYKEVFMLSYFWSQGSQEVEYIQNELKREDGTVIPSHVIEEWNKCFRDTCLEYLMSKPTRIGGPGAIIEIDGAVVKRRGSFGGSGSVNQPVFRGVQRGTDKCFAAPADNADAESLLPIIVQYVLPGSIVMSDLWRDNTDSLPEEYRDMPTSYSIQIVKPDNSCRTRSIYKKRANEGHFGDYTWRRQFGDRDALFKLWSQIAAVYQF